MRLVRTSLSTRSARLFACLTGALSLVGCRSLDFVEIPEAKDWNLRELHDADGNHTLQAATLSDTEYFLRFGIGNLLGNSKDRIQEKKTKRVTKAPDRVLDNVLALSKFSAEDPRIATMQAKWLTWLAVADPWALTRERCVLGLGQLANQLSLDATPGRPPEEAISTPEEVEVALAQLIRASKTSIFEKRAPDETEALDIVSACQVVNELELDVEGGHRALEVIELLLNAGDVSKDFREPLIELSRSLTERLTGQVFALAVRDEEPVVRAAAVQAIVHANGTSILRQVLEQMTRESSPVVLNRVMQLIQVYGLPDHPKGTTAETARRVEEVWIDVLYSFATQHPEGSVRTNAMLALTAVADGPDSLREEEWQNWWIERAGSGTPSEPVSISPSEG